MFAKVISLFDVNNIVDLKVSEQPLVDIIEEIKREEINDENRVWKWGSKRV